MLGIVRRRACCGCSVREATRRLAICSRSLPICRKRRVCGSKSDRAVRHYAGRRRRCRVELGEESKAAPFEQRNTKACATPLAVPPAAPPKCVSGFIVRATCLLGFAGWRCKAGATRAPTLPELLALLGRHLVPALVHALAYTLIDAPPHMGARRAMAAPSAEEDAAQCQKSQGLPE